VNGGKKGKSQGIEGSPNVNNGMDEARHQIFHYRKM
jgi:hypothetical protein